MSSGKNTMPVDYSRVGGMGRTARLRKKKLKAMIAAIGQVTYAAERVTNELRIMRDIARFIKANGWAICRPQLEKLIDGECSSTTD
jgi:hypothetical protein